jgi:hypothetical protein
MNEMEKLHQKCPGRKVQALPTGPLEAGIIHYPKTQHFKVKKFWVRSPVNLSLPPEFLKVIMTIAVPLLREA